MEHPEVGGGGLDGFQGARKDLSVLSRIFRRTEVLVERDGKGQPFSGKRISRHSSGWSKTSARLKAQEGLSVLDIGPTSHSNINYLTSLGHSVFMADLVEESTRSEWLRKSTSGLPDEYDVEAFIEKHMNFGHRMFHVVLLWDALNYMPGPFVEAVVRRLHASMVEEGEMLGLFRAHASGHGAAFCRYHLTDGENVEMQEYAPHPLLHIYQNRAIEKLFAGFSSCRFFLAKDNLCEVVVVR